jgi:hypothetical protein
MGYQYSGTFFITMYRCAAVHVSSCAVLGNVPPVNDKIRGCLSWSNCRETENLEKFENLKSIYAVTSLILPASTKSQKSHSHQHYLLTISGYFGVSSTNHRSRSMTCVCFAKPSSLGVTLLSRFSRQKTASLSRSEPFLTRDSNAHTTAA